MPANIPKSIADWISMQPLLTLARGYSLVHGKHKHNPYHNTLHCKLVSDIGVTYGYQAGVSQNEAIIIGLAGIFHDFNHSGEPLTVVPDSHNIKHALNGFVDFAELVDIKANETIHDVCRIIINTEVKLANGQIVFKDCSSPLDRYIRDADLSMALFEEGQCLKPMLAVEMGLPYDNDFEEKNSKFIKGATLYTLSADYIRNHMEF